MKAKISFTSLLLSAICCSDFCLVNGALQNYRFSVVTAKHIVPPWYQAQCPTGQLIFYFQIFILFHKVYVPGRSFLWSYPRSPQRTQVPVGQHQGANLVGQLNLTLAVPISPCWWCTWYTVPLPGVISLPHATECMKTGILLVQQEVCQDSLGFTDHPSVCVVSSPAD